MELNIGDVVKIKPPAGRAQEALRGIIVSYGVRRLRFSSSSTPYTRPPYSEDSESVYNVAWCENSPISWARAPTTMLYPWSEGSFEKVGEVRLFKDEETRPAEGITRK